MLQVAAADGTGCATDGCDVDRDGRITVTDGVLALRRAAGLAIVDRCGTATVTGRLLVPPARAASVRAEREPNDGPGTAEVAGRLAGGMRWQGTGTVGGDDAFDARAFVAAGDLGLDLDLTFAEEPGTDLDLLVDDPDGGTSLTCESSRRRRERCRILVGGEPRRIDVVVVAAAGSPPARYTLTVRSDRTTETSVARGVDRVVAGRGAGGPIDVEPAVYRGEAAPMIPGEIVVAAAGHRPPAGPIGRRTLAATATAAGFGDGLTVDLAAPDGTMLVALPAIRAEAARFGAGGSRARGIPAKRARAALRARTAALATALAGAPGVRSATPNRLVQAARVPRDPLYPRQWALDAIGVPRAWDVTIGAPQTVVAVVDTGIRSDHPDLRGRLVAGFDFISSPGRANDGDGIDPDPFDPGDRPTTPEGGSFHGTHVAGTIAAATDDPEGVAGVTWRTGVMPLRVLGVGGGSIFDVAQAVRYAAGLPNVSGTRPETPARIINLSLTTSGDDAVLRDAIAAAAAAGALVVAAAGNTGRDGFLSPAGFPDVLAVAATDRLGAPARYSSFGASVDLAAPGGDTRRDRDADGEPDGILSTLLPGERAHGLLQGTSMASAHVSGVAALLLGVPGGATAADLRRILVETADDRGAPGRDDRYGAGIVDAAGAVRRLAGLPPPLEPVLRLDAPAVRVAADESAPRVTFRNAGGGTLVVGRLAVETDDDGGWLGATVEDRAVRLFVDRESLAPGVYGGRVLVDSNGGAALLEVVAEVAGSPPEDLGPVTVVLQQADTGAVVASTITTADRDYRWRLADVPPGNYVLRATTDRDGDGALCDAGEACGAYPERIAPLPLTLFGGATLRARDFGLALILVADDR